MPYPIKPRNHVKIFMSNETQRGFTHADFTTKELVIYSQRDWTNSIDKWKFNELVDNAAGKFEVAQTVNYKELEKQAQLQALISQLQTHYINYFIKLFISGKNLQFAV